MNSERYIPSGADMDVRRAFERVWKTLDSATTLVNRLQAEVRELRAAEPPKKPQEMHLRVLTVGKLIVTESMETP